MGGTSIGSIIAAGYAMGLRSAEALALCKKHFSWILDPTFPLVSLLAGRRAGAKIEAFFGDREIEDFRIPYFCVSTNLTTARETIHSSGVAAHSVRASISIPGVLPPVVEDGDLLVDGGLVNNVPVDVMERVCMRGPVIAVEVTPEIDLGKYYQIPPALSGWNVLWERINPLGKAALVPDIVTILARSTVVASTLMSRGRPPSGPHTLRLALPVADWGMFEFGSVEPLAERGYEASIEPIREWWAGVGNA